MKKFAIILGSRSDLPQLRETIHALRKKYVSTIFSEIVVHIQSIHRNPVESWKFVFEKNCLGADGIGYCGSKAFAAPGALDGFIAAANQNVPVLGVALGDEGSEAFNAAVLSIKQLPGQYVIMDENGEPYVHANGLKAAVERFAEGKMPEPKERTSKSAEYNIDIDS